VISGRGFLGRAHMCSSSMAAKLFQDFLSAWTLLPAGHHWTLPRPMTRVPSSKSPVRISRVIEFLLLRFVNSTELGRLAITCVFVTRRRLGMPESYHVFANGRDVGLGIESEAVVVGIGLAGLVVGGG